MKSLLFSDRLVRLSHRDACIERPRIHQLLEAAVQKPLVIVVAGTGYGKTQAVCSFLQQYDAMTTWIQLSERDNLSARFWENFTHTIALFDPTLASRLIKFGFPETKRCFDRYLCLPKIEAEPGKKYIMVFDGFHLIYNQSVLQFIEKSVHILGNNLSTILISRTEPDINTIDLLSEGLISRINEDDLRFSESETRDYLRMQKIKLSQQSMASVYNATEGWAFALNLLGSFIKGQGQENLAISAMKRNIFKLIESKIFSTVPESFQRFLIRLSLIEYLPSALVKELADGEDMTAEMAKVSAFVRYDAYLDIYRLQHLFLDYLRQKQELLGAEEKRDTYLKGARWCMDNNRKLEAVTYCEKACHYRGIIEIICMYSASMSNTSAEFFLKVINRIEKCENQEQNDAYLALRHIFQPILLVLLGKYEQAEAGAKASITTFKPLLAQAPFANKIVFSNYHTLGFIYALTCIYTKKYDFYRYFEKAEDYYERNASKTCRLIAVSKLGSYVCRVCYPAKKGEFQKAIEALDRSVPHLSKTTEGYYYGIEELARCEFSYYTGELEKAEKFAHKAIYKAREKGQYEIENRALFYLLRMGIHTGNYASIQSICGQLDRQLKKQEFENRHLLYDLNMGWYYVRIGQVNQVAGWLKNEFKEREMNILTNSMETVVRAKYYLSEKKYQVVLAMLEIQQNKPGIEDFLLGRLEMKVLEAVCLYHLKEKESAMAALTDAYDMAESNSLDIPFIELGKDMRLLIQEAMKETAIPWQWLETISWKSAVYAKNLTFIASKYRKEYQLREDDIQLSPREMKILIDLYHGFSRSEIAASHYLSVNTIKKALQVIYEKLGAENNVDAIRIALDRKLIK
jgi:LuxR family maltose regulon positive regulatory protein